MEWSLGAALLADSGLEQYGLKILAGFDIRDEIVNTKINNIPIYHTDEFIEKPENHKGRIGVLTVPADIAQQTADYLIESIRGIWNFTPFPHPGSRRYCPPKHIDICPFGRHVQSFKTVAQIKFKQHEDFCHRT